MSWQRYSENDALLWRENDRTFCQGRSIWRQPDNLNVVCNREISATRYTVLPPTSDAFCMNSMLAEQYSVNTLPRAWGAQTHLVGSSSVHMGTDGTRRDVVTGETGTSVTVVKSASPQFCPDICDTGGREAIRILSEEEKEKMASGQETVTQNYRKILVKAPKGAVREMVLPRALDIDRPKRARTAFTADQLKNLERAFRDSQYVVGQDRTELARQLQLTETQVKVWFQNRRTKHKRDKARQAEKTQANSETLAALNIWKLLQTAPPGDTLPPMPTHARSAAEVRDLGRGDQPVIDVCTPQTQTTGNFNSVLTNSCWQPTLHQGSIPQSWPHLPLLPRQNYDNIL